MNNSNTSHNIPHTDWQMLGELKLPVGSSTEDARHAWLSEVLAALALDSHFLDQILQSAQEAAGRAMRSEQATECRQLHFRVHAPKYPDPNGQTWGFFQVEKMGTSTQNGNPLDHLIELYIYLEE